ncbi:hypothetical protein WJX81_000332 [Elliptochloris bilobata]|uniref:Uncharacterized protein n=1 Tax=Elliptochloris bilobata TaxID=381761 RepID=A0AAW1RE48_9CHLO
MAGINRLGAGPRKPGIARPIDPNRFIVQDLVPEGVENDQDYKRMVQDIEDAQQSQVGWLFGRGAFDKSDLMYLRDEEERQRFTEDERRDRELQQFQKQRARLEPAAPGPAPPRPVRRDKDKGGSSVQAKVLSKLRVKAAAPAGGAGPPTGDPAPQAARATIYAGEAPAAKRQRADRAPSVSGGAGAKRAETTGAGSAGAGSSGAGPACAGGGRDSSSGQARAGDPEEGLAGLLGAYGSDEEEEEDEKPVDQKGLRLHRTQLLARRGQCAKCQGHKASAAVAASYGGSWPA